MEKYLSLSPHFFFLFVFNMRTPEEINARQQQFCNSYSFSRHKEYTPKMKAWESAINVSVKTRGCPVYSSNAENREDAVFFWMVELETLGEKYKHDKQTKEQFIQDVFTLQDNINNSNYNTCFQNNHIRLGQCQKSLSVFLKWMWCQNELADIPPVCPIDRQVLQKCYTVLRSSKKGSEKELRNCGTAWTKLDDRSLYCDLIAITEKVADLENEPSTAVWELFAFREPEK